MKKILFIYRVDKNDVANSGVVQKLQGQQQASKDLGYQVHYVINGNRKIYKDQKCIFTAVNSSKSLFNYCWFRYIKKSILENFYDLIIIRYGLSTPHFIGFLKTYKKVYPKTKIVIDMPTYPYEKEWTGIKGHGVIILDRLFRQQLCRYVDFIIHLGEEEKIFDIPTIRISNGINSIAPLISKKYVPEKILDLLAVGKWQDWHGLDRLLYGLALSKKPVCLHIVGSGPKLDSYLSLGNQLGLMAKLNFHGSLAGSKLDELFSSCDLGIGTLGLHRKNVAVDSSLKHREYCFRGLPFILSSIDNDFPNSLPFVKYFPVDDSPIDIEEITSFNNSISFSKDLQEQMRNYALTNLSWKTRLKIVLNEVF